MSPKGTAAARLYWTIGGVGVEVGSALHPASARGGCGVIPAAPTTLRYGQPREVLYSAPIVLLYPDASVPKGVNISAQARRPAVILIARL